MQRIGSQVWSRPLAGAAADVAVWFVPAGANLNQYARILDRNDWSAIARLRDPAARDHLRATRIALRLALTQAVDGAVKPEAWRFEAGSYGKPRVAAGLPAVHFSVSHIETMSVIAVSTVPVGIDIEAIDRSVNDRLLDAACSAKERRALANLDARDRQREFARLWALKEACAKLHGTGLAEDFRYLEFGAAPERTALGNQAQHIPGVASIQSWTMEAPGGLCQVAVAVGETDDFVERGEVVGFVVEDDGGPTATSRTLNPGRGEQSALALS